MHSPTRWHVVRERVLLSIATLIFCVPLVLIAYGFGAMLGQPTVGVVLAVFVVSEFVWDVGPMIWKD